MIIVISPAKKLDFKSNANTDKHTIPAFLDKSAILTEELRQFSPSDLAILMNVSNDLANFTFERYSQWRTPFDTGNAKQALLAFNGDVYRSMEHMIFQTTILTLPKITCASSRDYTDF